MKLVFATNNRHKLDEVRAIVGDRVEVLSLNDIECHDEIPETADTLQGNALIKARYIYEKYGLDCFADDTGLEVRHLAASPEYTRHVMRAKSAVPRQICRNYCII